MFFSNSMASFFVREFPFYINVKLHYDIRVDAGPSILAPLHT